MVDFTPPFKRIGMIEGLEASLGVSIPADLWSEEARAVRVVWVWVWWRPFFRSCLALGSLYSLCFLAQHASRA